MAVSERPILKDYLNKIKTKKHYFFRENAHTMMKIYGKKIFYVTDV